MSQGCGNIKWFRIKLIFCIPEMHRMPLKLIKRNLARIPKTFRSGFL